MEIIKRKNVRLPDYDYSQEGGYFATICTHERMRILSRIYPGTERGRASVVLTELGQIAETVLKELTVQYGFCLDSYVIMPNHLHIVLIKENRPEGKQITLGQFIGAFKSIVTNRWCRECDVKGTVAGKVWQRNYYDHILRNTADHIEKVKYIDENPDKWHLDDLYRK